MKKSILLTIFFSFTLLPVANRAQELNQSELKKITGQAGFDFELKEITVKFKYDEISYVDTDGYGTTPSAGIKLRSHGDLSTLHFKPISDHKEYSNQNLRKKFGDSIGNIGLVENKITNKNAEINNKNKDEDNTSQEEIYGFSIPLSNLSLETTSLCNILTAINLYNMGQNTNAPFISPGTTKKIGGISVNLPSVETTMGGSTKDIMLFGADLPVKASNNNKIFITIEKGSASTVIFGGKIDIKANIAVE